MGTNLASDSAMNDLGSELYYSEFKGNSLHSFLQ